MNSPGRERILTGAGTPRAVDTGSRPCWESTGGILKGTTREPSFAIPRQQRGLGKAWLNTCARRAAQERGWGFAGISGIGIADLGCRNSEHFIGFVSDRRARKTSLFLFVCFSLLQTRHPLCGRSRCFGQQLLLHRGHSV